VSDLFFGTFSTDTSAPVVTAPFPANGLTGVDEDSNVSFTITDADAGVDLTSLIVRVGGVTVYDGGAGGFQPGYTGTVTDVGGGAYEVVVDPTLDMDSYADIDVTVDAQDLAPLPNVMPQYSWGFKVRDYEPPYKDNEAPTGTDHPTNSLIVVDIKDDAAGVDLAEVVIKVNGVEAYSSGAFQPGFQGPASDVDVTGAPNIYRFTIDPLPELDELQTYNVSVKAKDLA
jgi:hypothetical protein